MLAVFVHGDLATFRLVQADCPEPSSTRLLVGGCIAFVCIAPFVIVLCIVKYVLHHHYFVTRVRTLLRTAIGTIGAKVEMNLGRVAVFRICMSRSRMLYCTVD